MTKNSSPDPVRRNLKTAIEIVGGQAALAAAIGCTQPNVCRMLRLGRVAADKAVRIETATKGKVRAVDLNPDLAAARSPPTEAPPP